MSTRIFDRIRATWYEEHRFMLSELEYLHNSKLGRLLLNAVVSRRWFSAFYTRRFKTKASLSMIEPFIEAHDIVIGDFEQRDFTSFNDFFTRDFAAGARDFDASGDVLISPCDGKLSVVQLDPEATLQIKGASYRLQELVGAAPELFPPELFPFAEGICLVFRLSVDDGHRYIFVDDGVFCKTWQLNGRLHTVGSEYVGKSRAYAKNHRICQLLETGHFGRLLWIDVGALLVGRIINHPLTEFTKGQEKGYFEYGGSSIVLVFAPDKVCIDKDILQICADGAEVRVRRGESIGRAAR